MKSSVILMSFICLLTCCNKEIEPLPDCVKASIVYRDCGGAYYLALDVSKKSEINNVVSIKKNTATNTINYENVIRTIYLPLPLGERYGEVFINLRPYAKGDSGEVLPCTDIVRNDVKLVSGKIDLYTITKISKTKCDKL